MLAAGSLLGKNAIVTGGGTGIGKGITELLLKSGCNVAIASRNLDKTAAAAYQLNEKYGGQAAVYPYKCDIRKDTDIDHFIEDFVKKVGNVNYLVNNGGGQFIMPAEHMTERGWDAVVNTNLKGAFKITQAVFSKCMKQHGGSIVNILMALEGGWPGFSHSVSSRAGVEALGKTLAVEWGEYDVKVNNVIPGVIYSDTAVQNYGVFGPRMFREATKKVPLGRLGTPEDIAYSTVFLLTAPYVTGHSLCVDGGSSLGTLDWWRVVQGLMTGEESLDN